MENIPVTQLLTMVNQFEEMPPDDRTLFLKCVGVIPCTDNELRQHAKTISNALNTIVYASTPICEAHSGLLMGGARFDISAISASIDILYEKYQWVAIMTEMLGSMSTLSLSSTIGRKGRAMLKSLFDTLITPNAVVMENDPRGTIYNQETIDIVRTLWNHMAKLYPISTFTDTTRITDAIRDHFAPMRLRFLLPEDRRERTTAEREAEREATLHATRKRERRRRQAERRKQRKAEETSIREKQQAVADALAALEQAKAELDAAQRKQQEQIESKRREQQEIDRQLAKKQQEIEEAAKKHSASSEKERTECILCHDNYMDYFFVACGHGLCCQECYEETPASQMARYTGECAICRMPNIGPVRKIRV